MQLPRHGRMLPIFRQQSHAIDSRNARNRNHVGYVLKIDVVVSLDEGDALYANRENIGKTLAQVIPGDYFIVNLYFDVRAVVRVNVHSGMLVVRLRMFYLDEDGALRRGGVVWGLLRWLGGFG